MQPLDNSPPTGIGSSSLLRLAVGGEGLGVSWQEGSRFPLGGWLGGGGRWGLSVFFFFIGIDWFWPTQGWVVGKLL